METNMENRILRRTEVQFMTGLATSTLYAKMRAGEFPSSIKLGRRAVGWKSTDIEAWIQKCMEAENE
jgi:prophage regulatory protein